MEGKASEVTAHNLYEACIHPIDTWTHVIGHEGTKTEKIVAGTETAIGLIVGCATTAMRFAPELSEIFGGRTLAAKAMPETAEEIIAKYMDNAPETGSHFLQRAGAYSSLGEHELAVKDATEAIKLFEKPSGDLIKDLTPTAKSSKNLMDAYTTRGSAYIGLEQYEPAVADFTKAIEVLPPGAELLNIWGKSFTREKASALIGRSLSQQYLGKTEAAILDYKQAIDLDPRLTNVGAAARNAIIKMMGPVEST